MIITKVYKPFCASMLVCQNSEVFFLSKEWLQAANKLLIDISKLLFFTYSYFNTDFCFRFLPYVEPILQVKVCLRLSSSKLVFALFYPAFVRRNTRAA